MKTKTIEMKPIDQTILHDPDNGKIGDCLRACVASVLEIPIIDVPHFAENDTWIKDYMRFLLDHGWMLYGKGGGIGSDNHPKIEKDENEYYFAIGPSPRNHKWNHQVVCHKGEIVHDPHPDKTGIESITSFEIMFKR